MRYRTVDVTPKKAAEWLERLNGTNRALSDKLVNRYALDMEFGRWAQNAEAIKFAGNNRCLLDGQHRLKAIVVSGKTIPMLVATGLEESTFTTMDIGRPRGLGDSLGILGESNKNTLAAVIRCLYFYDKSDGEVCWTVARFPNPSVPELLEWYNDSDTIGKSVEFAIEHRANFYTPTCTAAMRCILLEADYKQPNVDAFLIEVSEGEGITKSNPTYLCRERLIRAAAERGRRAAAVGHGSRGVSQAEVYYILFRTWKAYCNNEQLRRLSLPKKSWSVKAMI